MRILLAEDEPAIAGFLKEGLEEEGFAVDIAGNGRQGLEMAMANLNEYDIILLDWMMPGISGIEICRNIRKENKEVPVIFLTAKDTVDDTIFGLEAGANDYLKKPLPSKNCWHASGYFSGIKLENKRFLKQVISS